MRMIRLFSRLLPALFAIAILTTTSQTILAQCCDMRHPPTDECSCCGPVHTRMVIRENIPDRRQQINPTATDTVEVENQEREVAVDHSPSNVAAPAASMPRAVRGNCRRTLVQCRVPVVAVKSVNADDTISQQVIEDLPVQEAIIPSTLILLSNANESAANSGRMVVINELPIQRVIMVDASTITCGLAELEETNVESSIIDEPIQHELVAGVDNISVGASMRSYPNPFTLYTSIDYSLTATGHVVLTIFDAEGRQVTTLVDDIVPAGKHVATWHAEGMPSGTYICRLQQGEVVVTRQLLLNK